MIVGHLHHDASDRDAQDHGHPNEHGGEGGGPPASASATETTITERLDPAVWEVVTAAEVHRTGFHDGGRETTLHDVVVRATRHY